MYVRRDFVKGPSILPSPIFSVLGILELLPKGASLKNLTKHLITLAKIVVSLGIIGYLVYSAISTTDGREAFVEMLQKTPNWGMLVGGVAVLLAAIVITLVRWWYLVRALDIDLSLPDAMRIGFLGYLFNLAPVGIVGGDLLKAWMLTREKSGSRAKALASVVVDRVIGLYVLFLVAATGVFITGLWDNPNATVHAVCWGVIVVTLGSTLAVILILLPGFLEGPLLRWVTRIPKIGGAIKSLLHAVLIYRSRRLVLFLTTLMTIPVHVLLALSLYLLALGLSFDVVSCRDYFAIYPISGIAQTIPLPAGPTEAGIVFLYKTALLAATQNGVKAVIARQQGLILALIYRFSAILIALIGAAYYFLGGRKEVDEIMHDEEEN